MKKLLVVLGGAAALVLPIAPRAHADTDKWSPAQTAITVGGGVADFAHGQIRSDTSVSGAWNARLIVGTRSWVGFEAQYLGTVGNEHDPVAPDPTVGTTQVTGSARFNLTRARIQPFLSTGVGWINLHSYGRDQAPVAASTFEHNEQGVVLPLGGGLAGYVSKHGMLDARFTYNLVTNASNFTVNKERPDMWVAQINAGYAF